MCWLEGTRASQDNLAILLTTQLNLEQIHRGSQEVAVTL